MAEGEKKDGYVRSVAHHTRVDFVRLCVDICEHASCLWHAPTGMCAQF